MQNNVVPQRCSLRDGRHNARRCLAVETSTALMGAPATWLGSCARSNAKLSCYRGLLGWAAFLSCSDAKVLPANRHSVFSRWRMRMDGGLSW